MPRAVECDHIGGPDHPGRLESHQFTVAGTKADGPQLSRRARLVRHLARVAGQHVLAALRALPTRRRTDSG